MDVKMGGVNFHLEELEEAIRAIAKLTKKGEEGSTAELRDAVMERTEICRKTVQRSLSLAVDGGLLEWATNAPYRTRYKRVGRMFDLSELLVEKGVIEVTATRKKGFGKNLSALDGGITAGAALPVGQIQTYEKALKEAAKQPNPATNYQEALKPDEGITHHDADAEAQARAAEPTPEPVSTQVATPTPSEIAQLVAQATAPQRPSRDSMILRLGTDLKAARDYISILEVTAKQEADARHEAEAENGSLSEQLKASLDKIATQEMSARTLQATINELNDSVRHKDREIEDLKQQLKQAWAVAAQAKPEFDNEEAALLSHLYPEEF